MDHPVASPKASDFHNGHWDSSISVQDHKNAMDHPDSATQSYGYFPVSTDGTGPLDFDDFSSASMFLPASSQDMSQYALHQWSVDDVHSLIPTGQNSSHPAFPMERSSSISVPVTAGVTDPGLQDVSSMTGFGTSPFSLPVSSGSSDLTDHTGLSVSDPVPLDPGAFSTLGLSDYDGMNCVSNLDAASTSAIHADHVNRLWMDMTTQMVAGSNLPLQQACEDQASLHSSQDDLPMSEDGRSNVWTASTVDSPDYPGSTGEAGMLSSYPMSRTGNSSYNYSCFSTDSGDYAGPVAYPSPLVMPSSRRSSMAQLDRYPMDASLPTAFGDGLPTNYGPVNPSHAQTSRSPVPSSRSTTTPRDSGSRRMSHGTRSGSARNDPLYHVGPQSDGLYHCPFEGDGCKHKPTNLKCNYDKYVDSHIKPYRCNHASCSSDKFSSTACLLRHEREAHGMHGHGEKPYACPYPDCDRSGSKGFPRRWNLGDHLKRVHGQKTEMPSTEMDAPAPAAHGASGAPHRRRRSSATQGGKNTKSPTVSRAKAGSSASDRGRPSAQRENVLRGLLDEEAELKARCLAYSQTLRANSRILGRDQLEQRTEALRMVEEQLLRLQTNMSGNPRRDHQDGGGLSTPD